MRAWPVAILLCGIFTGGVREHTVAPGETLPSVAARVGLDVATLAGDNGLSGNARLLPQQVLRIDNRHLVPRVSASGILVNVPQRMLFLLAGGEALAGYPIAAGRRSWPTPLGTFTIAAREIDPTWDVPVSIQRELARQGKRVLTHVPPGPANPLGDRWMGVEGTGIGIHGTNAPSSIYRHSTHGCIRLHGDDIRDLFDRVEVGTPVTIVYEPVLAAVDDGGRVWVEVHPDVYRRTGDLAVHMLELLDRDFPLARIDADALKRCLDARAGRACEVTAPGR